MDLMQANRMSQHLKALCDVNRIRILEILVQGEFCVTELVERLEIDQPKVSHHLAILRAAGVIRSRRDGRHINYSIRPTVHRRAAGSDGPKDVFDLGPLSVTFGFHEGAAIARVGAQPSRTAAASTRESEDDLEMSA